MFLEKPAPSKSMAGDKSSASDRCATDEDSDVGRRKKSSYINPLLKVCFDKFEMVE